MTDSGTLQSALDAIDTGDVEMLRECLVASPDLVNLSAADAPPDEPTNLLFRATRWPGEAPNAAAIVKLLLDSGANANARVQHTSESPLHWAASIRGHSEVVSALLDGGAAIDATGGVIMGGTPLMNALYFRHSENAELLVASGASVHNLLIAAGLGRLDLIRAWSRGKGEFVALAGRVSPSDAGDGEDLLSAIDTRRWMHEALKTALLNDQYGVADWLVDSGADIDDIPDGCEWSCLHHAAYCGSLPMAMYLVACGANLDVRSRSHDATPAGYGFAHGHPHVMNFLIDRGTPLSLADLACCGRLDHIIERRAEIDDPGRLLKAVMGNSTPVGKPIAEETLFCRQQVEHYLRGEFPGPKPAGSVEGRGR